MDLKAESGFRREKTEFASYIIQYTSGLSLLIILFSSADQTDSEFLFMQIFYHARCSIAHIHFIAEICL